jgi:hypothetical protein
VPHLTRAVRTVTSAAAVLSTLIAAGPLAAQADGTPVRVQTREDQGRWITGRAVGITADSIGIARMLGPVRKRSNDTVYVARNDLVRMQVSRGRKNNVVRGAIGGAAVGLVLGVAAAVGSEGSMVEFGGGAVAGLTVGLGGLGALFGALSHHEIWEEVPAVAPDTTTAVGQVGPGSSP